MTKNRAPSLPAPRTGDPALDAALLVIQTNFKQQSPETKRAFALVDGLPPTKKGLLASLMVPEAWAFSGPYGGVERYVDWLVQRLLESPAGVRRLAEVALDGGATDDARSDTVSWMRNQMNDTVIDTLVDASPPASWARLRSPKLGLVTAAAEAFLRRHWARGYDELAPLLSGKKVDLVVAEAILVAVDAASRPPGVEPHLVRPKDKRPLDARWGDLAIRFVSEDDDDLVRAALMLLRELPAKPEWRKIVEARLPTLEGEPKVLAEELVGAQDEDEEEEEKAEATPATKGPLPPEKRGRAPKPKAARVEPVAKLRKRIEAMLAKAGLSKHAGTLIDPAILLFTTRVDEKKLPLGATKIGGHPDLPPGSKWPEVKGVPLGFVAQIRLEDVAKLGEKRLPPKGLLSFFVDDDGEEYLGKTVVILTKAGAKLERLAVPATFQVMRDGRPARQPYAACAVELATTLTVPSPSNPAVSKLGKKAEAAYEEHVALDRDEVAQLLGFRDHGYDAENPASNRLLLRVTSDAQAAMCWGDADNLDIYVPRKDLERGSFARAYAYCGD